MQNKKLKSILVNSASMNSVENSFYATSSLSSVIPQLMLQPNCNYMAGKEFDNTFIHMI